MSLSWALMTRLKARIKSKLEIRLETKLKTRLKTRLYVEELLPVCCCWHGADIVFAKNLVANGRHHVVA